MKDFKVVEYQKEDLPAFRAYIKQAFHEKYILNDQKYIDWQFDKMYVIKVGEEIIGHFCLKDLDYKIYDKTEKVRLPMNLYVLKNYRLFGIGTLISKKVFDTPSPVLVSGYSDATFRLGAHLREKWMAYGNLKRFIAVLNTETPVLTPFKIPKIWSEKTTKDKTGIKIERVKKVDASFEKFWQEIRKKYPVTVERTEKYLQWRYIDNPFIDYVIFNAKKSEKLIGYLICRTEEDAGFKIVRTIDFVATDEAEEPLLNHLLSWASAEKAFVVDFMYSGNLYEKSLINSGFFDTKGTDFVNFPMLFSPISSSKLFINVVGDMPIKAGDYYFTKADGDQDRTNPH